MTDFWTIEERNRWADIRGRLDVTQYSVSELMRIATAYAASGPYHLSQQDRADIDRMIEVLQRVRDNALPCPDEKAGRESRRAA